MIKFIKSWVHSLKIQWTMLKAQKIRQKNQIKNPDYRCNKNTKRCFNNQYSPSYCYEYFGDNTPICCASHLYNILKDVTNVLEKNNLEYFISFGTLLGAIRHKGLIPWDTDVDVIIPERMKEQIFYILQKQLDIHYLVKKDKENNIVGSLIRVYLSHINTLHVDLFTYVEDTPQTIAFGYNRRFLKTDIYPLKKIDFYDIELFAPQDTHKHLQILYGEEYMLYAYKQWAMDKSKFKLKDYTPAKIELLR